MSQSLPAATEIDWKLVASAAAVFIGTVVTTVWGWFQGKKKSKESAPETASPFQLAGAVLQDNASLRDNTMAVRELRDQIFLLTHVLERRAGLENDLHGELEKLIRLLDRTG
jgi:hypothetical protein